MKSKLFKFALVGIIVCSFSLQGFTPPLPPTTTVCIDGMPSCYQVKVVIDNDIAIISQPRTRDWFIMNEAYSWNNGYPDFNISVYTKATSISSFVLVATINAINAYDEHHVDDYLYFIEIHWDQLVPPVPE